MLALLIVRQVGSATLTGLLQGIIVMVTGIFGSHGFLSIITYAVPGIFIDFGFLIYQIFNKRWLLFLPTALGNMCGSFLVGTLFIRLPRIPLIFSLVLSFIFGGMAGYLSWALYKWLGNMFPIIKKEGFD